MKTAKLYAIKNASGQTLGTYRALTAKAAIARFVSDQAVYASTFRRSNPGVITNVTAEEIR